MSNFTPKILLIGPRFNSDKSNVGGATVSFENLVTYFKDNSVDHQTINTQHFGGALGFIYLFLKYFQAVWFYQVVFLNVSQKGLKYSAPIIYFFTKALGKKMITRPFGGAIKSQYATATKLGKWVFKNTFLKSDITYLQTKSLINFFRPITKNLIQLKTSRSSPEVSLLRGELPFQKKFVFVGHIKKTKGIDELLAVINELGEEYTVDLYGPVLEQEYQELSEKSFYKGILKSEDVLSTLRNYDVIVLPTYYEGEGYAGSLIEAYSLGLPVITTNWKALPEIVEEGKTGFLVQPKSVEELKNAVLMFNKEDYTLMSENAFLYYKKNFEVNTVMNKVMTEIITLLK